MTTHASGAKLQNLQEINNGIATYVNFIKLNLNKKITIEIFLLEF